MVNILELKLRLKWRISDHERIRYIRNLLKIKNKIKMAKDIFFDVEAREN